MNLIEDRMDRQIAKTEADVVELKDKVDFFVQVQTPPLQRVFYEGQVWDVCSLVKCCRCESVANSQFQFSIRTVA